MRKPLCILRGAALSVAAVVATTSASAHTRIKPDSTLHPRSPSSSEKTGPCGSVGPTTDPNARVVLTAGQDLVVSWEETVQHPGHFRVAFSTDGLTGFDDNILKDNIPDDQNGAVDYNNPATYHQFNTTVKVPKTNCEHCSIQVIQTMTENPAAPRDYHSCADIRIVGGTDPVPAPATPAPGNGSGTGTASASKPARGTGSSASGTGTASEAAAATVAPAAPTGLKLTVVKGK